MSSLSDELDRLTQEVRALEHRFKMETAVCVETTYSYYYSKGALDYRDKMLDAIQSDLHMDKGVQALLRSMVMTTYPDPFQFTSSKKGLE